MEHLQMFYGGDMASLSLLILLRSSQGVKSKGKKLLKMQNATGLISCKSDQISRSDASW